MESIYNHDKEKPFFGWGDKKATKEKYNLVSKKKANPIILSVVHWYNIFIDISVK